MTVAAPGRRAARLFAVAAYALGVIGQSAFFVMLWLLGLDVMGTRPAAEGSLPWFVNTGLLALFAAQHSGMARRSFGQWLGQSLPVYLHRSLYVG
ncbi:MAG: hypothetical protein L0215_15670, partial [Gemmataceae bacterium]|nr:hypothetical protein [Gemmataceae bacterium]